MNNITTLICNDFHKVEFPSHSSGNLVYLTLDRGFELNFPKLYCKHTSACLNFFLKCFSQIHLNSAYNGFDA